MLLSVMTGCSNIICSGLMNSNTVSLDPSMNRTAYLQLRNISETQNLTLSGVQIKLTAKDYQLTNDPAQANYWIQAKVVYCHKAAEGVPPESIAKANFGVGISSGGTAMASANSRGVDHARKMMQSSMPPGDMMGMSTMPMGGGMPDMNAMSDQVRTMGWDLAMSDGHGGFPCMQMQQTQKEEGITYSLCN